jgi:serine/threonine protein kinase
MIIDRDQLAAALPNYELKGQLGAGYFGLVVAGRHRHLERDVAIKVLAVADEGADDRFTAEARLLARMDHPHIVRVYDYVEHDGLHLIVMELLSGGSLSRRLVGIAPESACAVGIAVAEALSYAHAQGVLHRDIKPQNVLFDAADLVKVTDFGIAKIFDGSAATASVVAGTPAYMAPEQIIGGRLGPATDIYALGVVLYEMLAGTSPFDPRLPLLKRYEQQLRTTPPPPAGVPPVVADVVMHALATRMRARPTSAQAFASELTAAVDHAYGQNSLPDSRHSPRKTGTVGPRSSPTINPALTTHARAGAIMPRASIPGPPREPVVRPLGEQPPQEGIGQHLGELVHPSGHPRMKAWQWRAISAVVIVVGFSVPGYWLLGLTVAVFAVAVDIIVRIVRRRGARRARRGPGAGSATKAAPGRLVRDEGRRRTIPDPASQRVNARRWLRRLGIAGLAVLTLLALLYSAAAIAYFVGVIDGGTSNTLGVDAWTCGLLALLIVLVWMWVRLYRRRRRG